MFLTGIFVDYLSFYALDLYSDCGIIVNVQYYVVIKEVNHNI